MYFIGSQMELRCTKLNDKFNNKLRLAFICRHIISTFHNKYIHPWLQEGQFKQ
jgi:hypothetical protein